MPALGGGGGWGSMGRGRPSGGRGRGRPRKRALAMAVASAVASPGSTSCNLSALPSAAGSGCGDDDYQSQDYSDTSAAYNPDDSESDDATVNGQPNLEELSAVIAAANDPCDVDEEEETEVPLQTNRGRSTRNSVDL